MSTDGLSAGWTRANVEELGELGEQAILTGPFGASLGKDDFRENGVPVLTIGCLAGDGIDSRKLKFIDPGKAEELATYRLRKGDLLFSRMATVGRVGFVPSRMEGAIFNYHLMRLRLRDNVILKKYFYFFVRGSRSVEQYLDEVNRGATRDGINTALLSAMPIDLPPLPEQRRIVERIETLTDRSRRACEALDTLPALIDRYRQSILAAAFRGDLTADWRSRSAYAPIAETLAAVAPPSQSRGGREATDAVIQGVGGIAVNDPGTPLPHGWAWVALRRVARQETGHTPSRSVAEYWDGDIAWLGIKDANIHHGKVISDTAQHITQKGLDNSSARLLPSGTVCLSRTASVGYVTIMGKDMATSQDFATWTCGDALDPHYLMYALMSEGDNIRRFGEGSTHTTIYFPEIRAFHIALAPVEEQREIVRRIKAAMAAVDVLEGQLRAATSRLATLDQSILAKAFRGELVPQDPNDEPASVLLERIRAERAAAGPAPRRGRRPKAAGG